MKTTKEEIKLMKELRVEGLTYQAIADKMKIHICVVGYHLNPKTKQKTIERAVKRYSGLSKEKKKALAQGRKDYIREYFKKKYNSNEEFREVHKERCRKYYRNKYKGNEEFRKIRLEKSKEQYSKRKESQK